MTHTRLRWLAALLVLLLALTAAACGGDDDEEAGGEATTEAAATTEEEEPENTEPIVIGWAFDSSGNMAPFDGPALAAAKIRVEELNEAGGVDGRDLQIETCDTQNNDPAKAKA